jgi:putative flippase GtrA
LWGRLAVLWRLKGETFLKIDNKTRKEMIKFLIAGTIINATDFGIYYILFHFLAYSISKGISFTCAGIVGYLLNKYLIFKRNQPSSAEIGRYALINIIALGINVLTNQCILRLRPGSVLSALVIASVLTGIFTFACFKWWVFRTLLREKA